MIDDIKYYEDLIEEVKRDIAKLNALIEDEWREDTKRGLKLIVKSYEHDIAIYNKKIAELNENSESIR